MNDIKLSFGHFNDQLQYILVCKEKFIDSFTAKYVLELIATYLGNKSH